MSVPVYIPGLSPYGYGGSQYGYSPYGSGVFPRPPIAVDGGYGGQQYGFNSYGSLDIYLPRISSAVSLDGFRIEVFFSEEVRDDAALVDADNYTLTPTLGAPSTVLSVAKGTAGVYGGYTSVILTHSGTTLGGEYVLTATTIADPVGVSLLTLGDVPSVEVHPTETTIELTFVDSNSNPQDMVTEATVSPGIEDADAYSLTTDYPAIPVMGAVTHPVGGDASRVDIEVANTTSTTYTLVVGPATAINYDATALPSDDPGFTGTELGSGVSSIVEAGLQLSKASGVTYGWGFADTSGRLLPSSTFRMDIDFDLSGSSVSPALYDALFATASFCDGAFQVDVAVQRVGGLDVISVTSGAFSRQVPASWSAGATTLSMVRNHQAGLVSVLVNDTPLITAAVAAMTGPPVIAAGCSFLLSTNYTLSAFLITSVGVTSTQTVFTTAWNFLHNVTAAFIGAGLSRSAILTERGPLVKTWGDATPATKNDVEVRVNGTAVEIDSVNPYTGVIYPTIPIPLAAPGTNTVEMDYAWMPNPTVVMASLNTAGLVTNKSDIHVGNTAPSTNPNPASSTGAPDRQRFPYTVVIGPHDRPKPRLIGHRYLGFERNYSALTNSPTTLLTNADPHRVAKPGMEAYCSVDTAGWEAEVLPGDEVTPWSFEGMDTGSLVGDGTYTLIDASAGTFADGTAAVYSRDIAVDCAIAPALAARYVIDAYDPDGVFTGVGFGFHHNYALYLVGNLVVNGLRHVGILLDPENPHLVESWSLGPTATITLTSDTTFTVPSDEWPGNIETGDQFQILDGSQAGIYTIAQCGIDDYNGTVTVTITGGTFPADITLEGNDTAVVVFETKWDESPISYRLVADTSTSTATLFIGGTLADGVVTVENLTANIPAETALLIPTGDTGRTMFGSFSREATNTTTWSFFRHNITPESLIVTGQGFVSDTDFSSADLSSWFLTNSFGFSEVDTGAGKMLLKSLSGSDTFDLSYGFAQLEPFLSRPNLADLDVEFRVEHASLPATLVARMRDDLRDIRLAALLFRNTGAGFALVNLPRLSVSGLQTLVQEGWSAVGVPTFTEAVRGELLTHTQTTGQYGTYRATIDTADTDADNGRALEVRFRVDSYTADPGTGLLGAFLGFNVDDGGTVRRVGFALQSSPSFKLVLTSEGTTEVASFPLSWDDGEFHSLRIAADVTAGSVTVIADDTVLGSAALNLFTTDADGGTEDSVYAKMVGTTRATVVTWDAFSVTGLPLASYDRTLGLWSRGDVDDIDSYVIPRTDGLSVKNSSASAAIESWDWTSYVSVRLHLDPTWGVSLFRPDLPLPATYTGTYATETTDPTAAWVNIEYKYIPRHTDVVGSIYFGSLDSRDISTQRWDRVKYRIYNVPDENYIAPQGMVTNRFNVIHSGELNTDTTPEVVVVSSLTSTIVSVRSANITASRVFFVQVDGVVLGMSAWSFDADSQLITLASPLPDNRYPVTITLAPGKPVTTTYLQRPAVSESVTLLNEGTPPFPKSQIANADRSLIEGDPNNDPSTALNANAGFVTAEPWNIVSFDNVADTLYEELSFFELDDGGATGWIKMICDGPAPEEGWIELSLDGTPGAYTDHPVSVKGTKSAFDPTLVFIPAGGVHAGTAVAGGVSPKVSKLAVVPATWQGTRGAGETPMFMAVNSELRVRLVDVQEDTVDIAGTWSDNVPPSVIGPVETNPSGTPGVEGHGAVLVELADYSGDGVSRVGPWGGIATLEPNSLVAGGAALTGAEFTPVGGVALPGPTRTTQVVEASN